MSDAYEIGVSLALDDGVSASMERARQDLARFSAILQAGIPVQRLREAGCAAVAPPPVRPAEVEQAATATAPAAEGGDPEFGRARSDARVDEAARDDPRGWRVMQAAMASGTPVDAPARPVTLTEEAGETRAAAPVRDTVAGAAAAAPERPAAPTVAEPPASPGQQPPVWPAAPVRADVSGPEPTAPDTVGAAGKVEISVPIAPPVSPTPPAGQSAMPAAAAPPAMIAPVRMADLPQGLPAADLGQAGAPAPFPWPAPEPGVAAGAPYFAPPAWPPAPSPYPPTDAAGSAAAPDDLPAPQQSAPAAPRTEAAAQQGPGEGDVYLDGMLVGRWMSRFLNREAGRASAGPTSFDGRRTALMPGPTVGG
jgi:hypothetical protein